MRAAVCDAYGPPETIRVREVPSPVVSAELARNEAALLELLAAGRALPMWVRRSRWRTNAG